MTSFYGATSGVGVLDPYDAMIFEYIEEKHITAYSLLSHHHTTVIQPAINNDIPAGIPSESCQSQFYDTRCCFLVIWPYHENSMK
ncbi:hypothetical protein DAEQUDRAFT_723727 [Daedalea quercina L-15889]|uniref:Uncharacterized protein n=1 Tax=Daedalea quercina L-15889 TaxID=1314783 RepID=A0A165S8M6_9APHY|nr:hypothetical protein DAEQUDRAFT_723727 [Daedalea quercina L-15889]